jgi:hypothetical protein
MSDDPDVIPPKRLPVRRGKDRLPVDQASGVPGTTGGVVESGLTGFQAKMQSYAYQNIEKNIRAQTGAIHADTDRRHAALRLRRKVHELEEIDEILDASCSSRCRCCSPNRILFPLEGALVPIIAELAVLKAEQPVVKERVVRDLDRERWYAEADSARAEAAIRAAEFRAAEKPDEVIDVRQAEAAPAPSPLFALERQLDELDRELQEATADGRGDNIARLEGEKGAMEITIAIIKRASGNPEA